MPAPPAPEGREALVAEARAELERHGWPRVEASLILIASGGAAFLASIAMLWAGLHSMAARYALASVVGYLAFVLLIRLWVAWQRGQLDLTPDLPDMLPDGRTSSGESTAGWFRGGRSGGGGGGASFDAVAPRAAVAMPARSSSTTGGSSGSLFSGAFDDDAAWILLALAIAAAGLVAVLYVVYAAPLLLAEVALDTAVMSGIYRRLRREDTRHWTTGVFRNTWIPALVIVACAAGVGFCAQQIAPEARSIGGVIRALRAE